MTQKSNTTIHWFSEVLPKLIPRLAERLKLFFHSLKTKENTIKIMITPELNNEFCEINDALEKCWQLSLRRPLPNNKLILMTDTSFQVAGYAVLTEDDPNQKFTSPRKTYVSAAYGSKTVTPSQNKISSYAKDFSAEKLAINEVGHNFCGTSKLVIILTESKKLTQFFQTKMIPPPLWDACDFVLQFSFAIAQLPVKMNTVADVFIRLESDPSEKNYTQKERRRCFTPNISQL